MNTQELKAEIVRHNETSRILAEIVGVTHPTFSAKINGKAEFTRSEIATIRKHYNLSSDRVVDIFFAD